MKGLKIRVPDAPLYTMFPKAVDAQENPLPTIEAKKFHEVQKYIVLTGHITEMLVTVLSAGTWAMLNEADRKIFEDVTREAGARATKAIVDNENRLISGFEKKRARRWSRSIAGRSRRRSPRNSPRQTCPGPRMCSTGCRRSAEPRWPAATAGLFHEPDPPKAVT